MEVRGDWLPRQVLGKFTALCAVLRMLYLALALALERRRSTPHSHQPDVVFCDGVSAMVPLLRLRGLPVLFYCHFPDKLLCTDRRAWLKRLYRGPLDWLEEVTTGGWVNGWVQTFLFVSGRLRGPPRCLAHAHNTHTGAATVVAVNSRFTAQVFREAFARIAPKHPDPAVIYPAINLDSFVPPKFDEKEASKGKKSKQSTGAFGA